MSDLAKKMLKAGFIQRSALAIGLKIFGIVASYLFTLSITNFYGASTWGQFSLAFVVLNVLSIISVFGLNTALLKCVAQYASDGLKPLKRPYYQTLGFVLLLSLPMQLGMYFFAEELAVIVFKKELMAAPIKVMSFALIPFSLLSVTAQVIRGLGKDVLFMLFTHVLRFFIPTLLVVGCYFLLGEQYVLESFVVGICILLFWSLIVNLKSLNKGFEGVDVPSFSALIAIGFPLLLANSSVFLKSWVDTFMIGIYMQPEDVGVYNVALKASLLVNLPLTAINAILAKNIASLHHKGETAELEKFVKRSTALIIGLAVPMGVGLILLRSYLLSMFGAEFVAGGTVLVVLVIGALFNSTVGSVGLVLQMTGAEKIYRNILLFALVLSIILNVLLIPKFGILGAGFSTVLTTLVWNTLSLVAVKKKLGFITIPFSLKSIR